MVPSTNNDNITSNNNTETKLVPWFNKKDIESKSSMEVIKRLSELKVVTKEMIAEEYSKCKTRMYCL